MKKFILLYVGPVGLDPTQPPITQAALEGWIQIAGTAVVDRGSLLIPSGKSVVDTGGVTDSPFPVFGYAIIQAESADVANTLIRQHPFLANGRDGNYEIEIMELVDGDIPQNALITSFDTPLETPETTQQPPQTQTGSPNTDVIQPTTDPYGGLNIPHETNQPIEGNNPDIQQRPPQV